MHNVIKTAKSVDQAIFQALNDLNATIDQVDVEVLDEGSKGIFGFFAKEAKVMIKFKYNPKNIVLDFLTELFKHMNLDVQLEIKLKEKHVYVNLICNKAGLIIGKRGQTLDSIEYITSLVLNKGNFPYTTLTLDTENYRQKRKETLRLLALKLSRKVKNTKKKVFLEAMSSNERRIIHHTLKDDKYVKTYSEGDEPQRHIVIEPV